MIALGLLLPSNYPKDTFPLTISSWKLPPTKIAFWMICRLHICPLDKWLRGKLPHRKIVPMMNYTWDSFYPRIRNRSTLTIIASSCFFFLPKFFQVGHFSVLALALQFIQAVAWYNLQYLEDSVRLSGLVFHLQAIQALCSLTRKMSDLQKVILDFNEMVLFCMACIKRLKWIHMNNFLLKKCQKSSTIVRKGKTKKRSFPS